MFEDEAELTDTGSLEDYIKERLDERLSQFSNPSQFETELHNAVRDFRVMQRRKEESSGLKDYDTDVHREAIVRHSVDWFSDKVLGMLEDKGISAGIIKSIKHYLISSYEKEGETAPSRIEDFKIKEVPPTIPAVRVPVVIRRLPYTQRVINLLKARIYRRYTYRGKHEARIYRRYTYRGKHESWRSFKERTNIPQSTSAIYQKARRMLKKR